MSDLNLINTLQLKIFVTVAEERTLKAAAVKIGQTPSGISQNIKALENFLGVTLFERDSRPILLTKAGRRLFALARELLQKNDEILEAVRSEKKKYETLRLGLGGRFFRAPAYCRAQ